MACFMMMAGRCVSSRSGPFCASAGASGGRTGETVGPMPISYAPGLSLDEGELVFRFIHASGPGGQNVNKVASAVQLRFDLRASPSVPERVRLRAQRLAGRRLTLDGVVVIAASRFRSQERNRDDAVGRLVEILREAAEPQVVRRATRPSLGEKRRRLEGKAQRSVTKRLRGRVED